MGSAIFLAVMSLAAAVGAWTVDRRRRQYTDQPTTPAAAVFAGRNEVVGKAWSPSPLTAYRTQVRCVWWDYVLEEERQHTRQVTQTNANGKTSTRTEHYNQWHKLDSKRQSLPSFLVVDATGSVEVRTQGAKITPIRTHYETYKKPREGGFLANLGSSTTGRYRETEEAIPIGRQLFVVGEAQLDQQTATPFIAKGDTSYVISTDPESKLTNRLALGVGALTVAAVALLFVANAVAVDEPGRIISWAPAVLIAAVVFTSMSAVITYNRLKIVGQNAERAWSLIDVQLRRRANLIPALRSAVDAQQLHEETTHAAIAAARPHLPAADELAEATAESQAQTAELRTLWARVEAHPDLRSGEGFANLQQQLTDTENRIAGARTFYNDSVTLLRDRSRTFPGALVARFVTMGNRELFLPAGFERVVPDLAPSGPAS